MYESKLMLTALPVPFMPYNTYVEQPQNCDHIYPYIHSSFQISNDLFIDHFTELIDC